MTPYKREKYYWVKFEGLYSIFRCICEKNYISAAAGVWPAFAKERPRRSRILPSIGRNCQHLSPSLTDRNADE